MIKELKAHLDAADDPAREAGELIAAICGFTANRYGHQKMIRLMKTTTDVLDLAGTLNGMPSDADLDTILRRHNADQPDTSIVDRNRKADFAARIS